MAAFKGDHNFRVYHDDALPPPEQSSSEDEETLPSDPLTKWTMQNYDVIEEVYRMFRANGTQVFGAAFYQHGGFHNFAAFMYQYTHVGPTDLLTAR